MDLCFSRDRDRRHHRHRDRSRSKDRSPEKPKKKYKFWDVPPVGYEHLTPKEYKELQGEVYIHFILFFVLFFFLCFRNFINYF